MIKEQCPNNDTNGTIQMPDVRMYIEDTRMLATKLSPQGIKPQEIIITSDNGAAFTGGIF
jgi:hypothetical protein